MLWEVGKRIQGKGRTRGMEEMREEENQQKHTWLENAVKKINTKPQYFVS